MKAAQRSDQYGMALLLEGLIGLTLVTLVLLVIFQLFPAADRSVSLADRTTQANYLARSLLEEQLDKEYGDLDPSSPILGDYKLDAHTTRRGADLSTEFLYKIEYIPDLDPAVDVKDVVVTVWWREGSKGDARKSSVVVQSAKGRLW